MEILSFVNIWMDLEGIMLRERGQERKTNTIWCHFHVEWRTSELTKTEGRMVGKKEVGNVGEEHELPIIRWIDSGKSDVQAGG